MYPNIFYNRRDENCIRCMYGFWCRFYVRNESILCILVWVRSRLWFFAHFQSKVNFATTKSHLTVFAWTDPERNLFRLHLEKCFSCVWYGAECFAVVPVCGVCVSECYHAARKVLALLKLKNIVHCGATNPIIVNRCRMHNFNNG